MIPLVAIIGRPNVGKSTLFNVLIRKRRAIVSETPGTTRDHLTEKVVFAGQKLFLLDTAGLETKSKPISKEEEFKISVQEQVRHVKDSADLIIHVVDAQAEITKDDREVANMIRKTGKPVMLVANKADNQALIVSSNNFYKLGRNCSLVATSALHKTGIDELRKDIARLVKAVLATDASAVTNTSAVTDMSVTAKSAIAPATDSAATMPAINMSAVTEQAGGSTSVPDGKATKIINVAIVGRPNVGKSSLLNTILGKKHAIVFPLAGTTLDANDTPFTYKDQEFNLIDTAGIKKRGKIGPGIETFSVMRALSAINHADVVILVLDSIEGVTKQDLHIAQFAKEANTGLILALNKWDLTDKAISNKDLYIEQLQHCFDFTPFASVVFTSALKGTHCKQLLDISMEIARSRAQKLTQQELKHWLIEAVLKHPPSPRNSKRPLPKIYSVEQSKTSPAKFIFTMKHKRDLHFTYPRYLEKHLRQKFGFLGTAIDLQFIEKDKPRRTRMH